MFTLQKVSSGYFNRWQIRDIFLSVNRAIASRPIGDVLSSRIEKHTLYQF